MIRLPQVLAVARAELRLTRRLVRYWVFCVMAWVLGTGVYLYYSLLHGLYSSYSATAASIGPRYLMAAFGVYSVLIFLVGFMFLGFDVRSRDVRERMSEVLDSRPFSNLELLSGRFVGIILAGWVPLAFLMLFLQGLGYALPALGAPFGEPIEPVSIVTFLFLMVPPAFALGLALVFLISLLARNRLLALVLLVVVLGVDLWASTRLPLTTGVLVDITGSYSVNAFASSIIPAVGDALGLLQRLAMLLLAFGLLGICAVVHPRLDGGSRARTALGSLVIVTVAVALLLVPMYQRLDALHAIGQWREAHAARVGEPIPDIVAMNADLTLEPGRSLATDLELRFRAPADSSLSSALFTLNPGLQVSSVKDRSGSDLQYTHDNGLLEITLPVPLQPATETTVTLAINGEPEIGFGYLDGARVPLELSPWDGQLFILGFDNAVFDPRYVALMPGIRWLPAAGPDVGSDDLRSRRPDFYTVDLKVSVPDGWLVAGPGKRHEVERAGGDGTTSFRFAPGAPVPEVCLVASRFTSRSADIEGVHFEALLHPSHDSNLEVLEAAGGEVRSWISERLIAAREAGLGYPYDGYTLVEVPTTLRGYGGGWRMDSVMAQPAMMLMRESGFPTARFDVPFKNPQSFADSEGGMPRAMRNRLEQFFLNDFSGGNLMVGAAKSFFQYQTAATGPEAIAVNFVLEDLTTHLVTDTRGYFSAHLFTPELNDAVKRVIQTYFVNRRRNDNIAAAVIKVFTSRPQVWATVLHGSLVDLDPKEHPQQTIDALTLKGGSLAQALYDSLGGKGVGELLATLREQHEGEPFTIADVVAAGTAIDPELGTLLTEWVTTTTLPGFVGERAEAYRLPDAEDGSARYQLLATVRNDEEVPGFLRISYRIGSEDDQENLESDPIRIAGKSTVRFATVVSRSPILVLVEPYISLNRDLFRIPLAEVNEEKIVNAEPLDGLEELPWQIPAAQEIVVDDLDDGFTINEGDASRGVRLAAKAKDNADLDQGLPEQPLTIPAAVWSRTTSTTAWGRYRHTAAYIRPGKGITSAEFTATLPEAGSWQLEIHLPHKQQFRRTSEWGTWSMRVSDSSGGEHQVEFDATAAARGWNRIDAWSLADGEVTVSLSDKATGDVVVADAIRWTPAGNRAASESGGGSQDAGEAQR